MRVLAVDYGRVRAGLAVSDALGTTAQPLGVVTRPKRGSLVEAVVAEARRVEAEEIVVGLPLRLDGSEGVAAEAARSFAKALGERSGLPVAMWDERMTTVEASRRMRSAGVSARDQRGVVDKVAAAVLLRSFLEARGGSPADVDDLTLPEDPAPPEPSARRTAARRTRDRSPTRRANRAPRSSRQDWREDVDEE
jgi:putative Holliday junction resolvase